MKKTKTEPKKLALNREAIKVLDDDALHQARGAGAFSSSKYQAMRMSTN